MHINYRTQSEVISRILSHDWLIEEGLTSQAFLNQSINQSHQTHYRSYRGRVFTNIKSNYNIRNQCLIIIYNNIFHTDNIQICTAEKDLKLELSGVMKSSQHFAVHGNLLVPRYVDTANKLRCFSSNPVELAASNHTWPILTLTQFVHS